MAQERSRQSQQFQSVFARSSRPQLPTLPIVPNKSSTAEAEQTKQLPPVPPDQAHIRAAPHETQLISPRRMQCGQGSSIPCRNGNPWSSYKVLGTLTQGKTSLVLCSPNDNSEPVLVKTAHGKHANKELEILKSLQHANIVKVKQAFVNTLSVDLCFEYYRFTLQELIHVHVPFKEVHVHSVAAPIFHALKFVFNSGFTHGQVTLNTIRVSSRKPSVVLADFENCEKRDGDERQTDLEALAAVLIQCMDQKIPAQPTHEYVNRIRAKRSESQVFGIDNAERWSGSKDLVDFLDDLLNENKLPSSKFARMHKFVDAHDQLTRGSQRSLTSITEVACFECAALWYGGQRRDTGGDSADDSNE
ncbi:MAG: hypothetical protein Q9159_000399 [Coniocarpon cinnabarinum]